MGEKWDRDRKTSERENGTQRRLTNAKAKGCRKMNRSYDTRVMDGVPGISISPRLESNGRKLRQAISESGTPDSEALDSDHRGKI